VDRSQPAAFGAIPQQDLGHGQADELTVGQPGWPAGAVAGFQQLVDGDVQCDDEVVETSVHEASLEVDVARQRQLSAASSQPSPPVTHDPIRHQ
jgi:hypothetical protein